MHMILQSTHGMHLLTFLYTVSYVILIELLLKVLTIL